MKAQSTIATVWQGGRTVLQDIRSEPPLTVRPTRAGVALVGSAAAPVGGDELFLGVDVGDGCSLFVEQVAATMVFPGPAGDQSHQDITISVGESAHLHWSGQPLISVVGSRHVQRVTINLAPTATLDYVEALTLGRSNERPGYLDTELRVVRSGVPLLHQRQIFGAEHDSGLTSAAIGAFDQVQHHLVVGPHAGPAKSVVSAMAMEMRTPVADDTELRVSISKRTQLRIRPGDASGSPSANL